MTIERFVLITISIIPILSLIYIPKAKIRKALLSFCTFQSVTWLTSIILAEKGIVVYPIRVFVKATNANFIPQFIFYPAIFMWFILIFPKDRSVLIKFIHYTLFVSMKVGFIYFNYKYTNICKYPNSTDYSVIMSSYAQTFFGFEICRLYITWFFKDEKLT